MMSRTDFDVTVIGGGPGGSAAAKKCAEGGLKTLLLEARKLPRNKVCTGMVMSEMAKTLVREEFGDPPREILTTPPYLRGFKLRAPQTETLTLEQQMLFVWRKDFDYWLNQVAQEKGAELRDETKTKKIIQEEDAYVLTLESDGEPQNINTRFLVGADGTLSVVRKTLFPNAEMGYQLSVRRCYHGTIDLDPEYAHYFYFPDLNGFEVNRKGDVFLMEMTPRPAQKDGSDIRQRAEEWLARDFGFTPGTKPLWRDGCFEPAMGRPPFSGPFPLAKGNALLVGNAAGLVKPISGEGIGTAIKSGLMAAESIVEASKSSRQAEEFYVPVAQEMVDTLSGMYPPHGKVREAASKGMDSFLEAFREIFAESIHIL